MTDSIVRNSTPTVPIANLVFVTGNSEAAQEIETVLHKQMNATGYLVVWKPVRKRSGTLRLLFATPAHAAAAIALLVTPYTFTLTADVPQKSMTFVLAPGRLRPVTTDGVAPWLVELPFQEV